MSDWSRSYELDRPRPAGSISSSLGMRPGLTSYAAGSNEMRGADIIAEYLVKEKVPYILGYAGHGAIGLLDGIYKQTDRIRHISPRIEQTAGFMADVYFRLTGAAARRLRLDRPRPDEPDDLGGKRLLRLFGLLRHHRKCSDHPVRHRRFAGRLPLPRRHVVDVHADRQEILAHPQGRGPGQGVCRTPSR